jgi:hypothetical protein
VFKCLQGTAPEYLSELLKKRENKGTRADDKNLWLSLGLRRLPKVDDVLEDLAQHYGTIYQTA